jgi:hypothetical protein
MLSMLCWNVSVGQNKGCEREMKWIVAFVGFLATLIKSMSTLTITGGNSIISANFLDLAIQSHLANIQNLKQWLSVVVIPSLSVKELHA